jgi:formylglycine-generating enzyme required for sulfatase activity
MRRWFLSYHSPDQALAERLKAAIERKDKGAVVFFAPESLRPGGRWARALAEAIDEASAFVLLVTDRGIGRWQEIEYHAAFDRKVNSRDFPVVLMLLEGQPAPRLAFLKQLDWIVTPDPVSEKDVGRLIAAVESGEDAKPPERWRYTSPYRGLSAMEEKDSDYFFGRERETVEVLSVLAREGGRLPVLLGNSGVGKSSLAKAGVIASLRRQGWPETVVDVSRPWPQPFANSRKWCFVTVRPGAEPIRALVDAFLETWQFDAGDPAHVRQRNEWLDLLLNDNGKTKLSDLLDETDRRYKELNQPEPPAFLLYVDQGEELYARSEERQRRRFSEILANGLALPRLRALMSIRSDFLGALHADQPLFEVRRQIDVPPLREAQLREVVSRPAALLGARFEPETLAFDIARRTAKDAGALPLLSYLLDDMWTGMVGRREGTLRLPGAAFDLGGVLVDRANAFFASHPESEAAVRRLLTLKLVTVREEGEPTKRQAPRSEFTDEEWRLVTEVADHPNRLLVTATPEGREAYAEVAHEAIFRRWNTLREWIAAEREFLAWRTGLEAARRTWENAPDDSKSDALLMGFGLTQALHWSAKRGADIGRLDGRFIGMSEKEARGRARRAKALVGGLIVAFSALVLISVAGLAVYNEQGLGNVFYRFAYVRALGAGDERNLKRGESFWECVKSEPDYSKYCPEMVVVPSGPFMMGSPTDDKAASHDEHPRHEVIIAEPFAASRFEATFDQWDECVTHGACNLPGAGADEWGRGKQPAINISWNDAQQYVNWLSALTGQNYRLLSEAEWEYAARAKGTSADSFGEDPAMIGEYAWYVGNSGGHAHPVDDKRKPNAFGLHNMHGNVFEWVKDCYHENYNGAPTDGSAWITGNCMTHVGRGGSWVSVPKNLRSATRAENVTKYRHTVMGFRVGRTLSAGAVAVKAAPGAYSVQGRL